MKRFDIALAAHIKTGLQAATKCRTLGLVENLAEIIFIQLDAARSRRLALWHTGNWRGD